MRPAILLITGLLLFNNLFSQPKTKEYFLEKSNKQKTTAWILLGVGAAAILTEALVDNSNKGTGESLTGGALTLGGVVCCLTSVPFFISSAKNKRKSKSLAIYNQKIILPGVSDHQARNHLLISLQISLR